MLFRKKYERQINHMKEKNREYLDQMNAPRGENGKPSLEKGDLAAMIISAFLVFAPIFLVMIGVLALFWFLLH